MKLSLLHSRTDTAPRVVEMDWGGLVALLATSRNLGVDLPAFNALAKAAQGAVKDGPAWIPGAVSEGRTDSAIGAVAALVLDFDALYVTDVDRLFERLSGRLYVAHTSASHSPERPKWRVVLALTQPIAADSWRERWTAATSHLELKGRLAPDRVAKNPSRLYYLPAHLDDVTPGFRMGDGVPLSLHELPALPRPKPRVAPALRWESSDFERQARNYLRKMGPAIEGAGGDDATYRAACIVARDFGLPESQALEVLREWNATCSPPWDDEDLQAKLKHALRYGKNEFGCRRSAFHHGGVDAAAVWAFIGSKA